MDILPITPLIEVKKYNEMNIDSYILANQNTVICTSSQIGSKPEENTIVVASLLTMFLGPRFEIRWIMGLPLYPSPLKYQTIIIWGRVQTRDLRLTNISHVALLPLDRKHGAR